MNPSTRGKYELRVAAATDIGRVRETNEDAHIVTSLGYMPGKALDANDEVTFDPTESPVLLAVSDGMGGSAAGEIASALAVEALRRSLPVDSPDWNSTLRAAVERANREVWNAAQDPARRGMGATMTAVCVNGFDAHLAEVGDSRAYLLRDGKLRLLTHDQSYVQALLDAGALTTEEAEQSPMRNIILSAMGQKADVRVDLGSLRLVPGDALLVCCDGLSNELHSSEIAQTLGAHESPRAACAALIEQANAHGGKDNISVIVAHVDHPREPRDATS
jgi:serine/threonine protein phosphatase PrpC